MTASTAVPEPIIACQGLSVAYGPEEILHDVSLEIPRGSFLPFVGPNGAGKTTLLRAILGLLKPRRGRIQTPFHRSPPGYVAQQKAIDPLYPVSARQIVAMGLYPQLGWWRQPGPSHRQTVERAMERLDLLPHAHKTYAELSGGTRQKVLIARALASGAEVLVMDEPTSELDEKSEHEVLDHLFRLTREAGKTVLLAHHGLEMVAGLATEIAIVNHGRVRVVKSSDIDPAEVRLESPGRQHRMGGEAK